MKIKKEKGIAMEQLMVIEQGRGPRVVNGEVVKKSDKIKRLFILQVLLASVLIVSAVVAKDGSSEIVSGKGMSIGEAAGAAINFKDALLDNIRDVFYGEEKKEGVQELPIELSQRGPIQMVKR